MKRNNQPHKSWSEVSLSKLVAMAKDALLAGGAVLRKGFSSGYRISYKSAIDPVTEVDRASEKKVISLIRERFPDHTFLAEESAFIHQGDLGESRPDRYRWVIDPLDGTVNFLHGIPHACVSVGVECGGKVLAGGVYDPFRDELFMAVRGHGATLNGKRIRVSPEKNLIRCLLVTGFPYDHQRHANFHAKNLVPFLEKLADVRRLGAAALDLSWIACGRIEVYWEFGLKPWDVAAGILLVQEAGGKVTDFDGKTLNLDHPKRTLASNGLVHSKILRLLQS